MKFSVSPFVLAALCILWGGAAHAEKADRNKPMNVEADALRYDDLKQTSVFTGRVVLTKGTILIRGKGKRHDRMPLPDDVGKAIVDYIKNGRRGPKTFT